MKCKKENLKGNPDFQDGVDFEIKKIRGNLEKNKDDFIEFLEKLESLGDLNIFFLDFSMKKVLLQVKEYWKENLPFSID